VIGRWIAVLAALLLAPVFAQAATPPQIVVRPPTRIIVTGTGTVTLPPDEATVDAHVETNSAVATDAVAQNEATYERVVNALLGIGIPRASITLQGYNVSYAAPPNPKPATPNPYVRYGFTVTRSFEISTRTLPLAGKIVDTATAAGATGISGVSFGLSNASAAAREAMRVAVHDATSKAKSLAADAHLRIIGVLTVQLEGGQPGTRVIAAERAAPATTFEPGNTTVTESVDMVFIAKP
jgi:uncharacterized protein YggE